LQHEAKELQSNRDNLTIERDALSKELETERQGKSDVSEQLRDKESALNNVVSELGSLKVDYDKLSKESSTGEAEREALETERKSLEGAIDEMLDSKLAAEEKLAQEEDRIKALQEELDRERKKVADSATTASANAESSQAELASMTRSRDDAQSQVKLATESLEKTKEELEAKLEELEKDKTAKGEEVTKVGAELVEANNAKSKLETELGLAAKREEALEKERDEVAEEIQKLKDEKAAASAALRRNRSGSSAGGGPVDMSEAGDIGEELVALMEKSEQTELDLDAKKKELKEQAKTLQEAQEATAHQDNEMKAMEEAAKLLEERIAEAEHQKEEAVREGGEKLAVALEAESQKAVLLLKEHQDLLGAKEIEAANAKREVERLEGELAQSQSDLSETTEKRAEMTKALTEAKSETEKVSKQMGMLDAKHENLAKEHEAAKEERKKLHEQYLEERKAKDEAVTEAQELKAANERTKEEVKRLVDENTALNIKVQTEMASLAFWLQDHKDLTAEMEEERALHKSKVQKIEERLADQEAQLHSSWEEKREASQHLKETQRALRHKEKEVQRKKDHEEKVAADMGELRNKMEVQSKLLTVQSQRMQELEKTARAAEEMVMAWKKHAEVNQMEKDEAVSIARTAQESAAKGGERTLAASKMVRSISKKPST